VPASYSEFILEDVKKELKLELAWKKDIFSMVQEAKVSEMLTTILKRNVPLACAINTEKARSELIVMPVLLEIHDLLEGKMSLFSGIRFNVKPEQGLVGVCDFLLSLSSDQYLVTAPVVSIVEAKNDNIKEGLPQCIAEMFAARLFNQQQGNGITTIYGVVTTGSIWKFLELQEQTVFIDLPEYYVKDVGKILGILASMLSQ
jgi:hypothetical protein